MKNKYTEDNLVEQKVIERLREKGYCYLSLDEAQKSHEFSDAESVLLENTFRKAVEKLNRDKNPSKEDIDYALREIKKLGDIQDFNGALNKNQSIYKYIERGIQIEKREKVFSLDIINWKHPEENTFTIINQFTTKNIGEGNSRPDLILFINGMPFVIFEFKNPTDELATLTSALDKNIKKYKENIPKLFSYNHLIVLSDWAQAEYGTISAGREHFSMWKAVKDESENHETKAQMEIMLEGLFDKKRLLDTLRFFTLFDDHGKRKMVCKYHQYYSVNKAIENIDKAIKGENQNKVGTLWHTQGSGKTISLAFIVKKAREVLESPSFVLLTDRRDLDAQITEQFEGVNLGIINHVDTMLELSNTLKNASRNSIIATTIQKFLSVTECINNSKNIIVIADEAHRTQYRSLAGNVRTALPNASFMGITGTPISLKTRDTNLTFGNNISEYTVTKAIKDQVIVPIFYDFVAPRLSINTPHLSEKDIDLFEEENENEKETDSTDTTINDILKSDARLEKITNHVIEKLKTTPIEQKALFAANSREIAFLVHKKLQKKMPENQKAELVLSNYEGLSDSYDGDTDTKSLAKKFQSNETDIRIVVVCDMWLTGFDVPDLYTIFLDKKLDGHNLMQAIARVNRVYKDKKFGLVVDYIGIVSNLNKAIERYSTSAVKNTVPELEEAIMLMNKKLEELKTYVGISIDSIKHKSTTDSRDLLYEALENVITNKDTRRVDEKRKYDFIKTFSLFERLYLLIMPRREAHQLTPQFDFMEKVSKIVRKTTKMETTQKKNSKNLNIDNYIEIGDILSLFDSDGEVVNIFETEVIKKMSESGFRNIAIEILHKVMTGQIKTFFKKDKIKYESFFEKLQNLLDQYKEGILSTKEILSKLKEFAIEIKENIENRRCENGLTVEEENIFSALEKGIRAKKSDPKTTEIIKEILNRIKEDGLIYRGWSNNQIIKDKIVNLSVQVIGEKIGDQDPKYEDIRKTGSLILNQLLAYEYS